MTKNDEISKKDIIPFSKSPTLDFKITNLPQFSPNSSKTTAACKQFRID